MAIRTQSFAIFKPIIDSFAIFMMKFYLLQWISARTAEEAGPRSDGLQKYIISENKKGKKLFGGILIDVNGTWMYTDNKKYFYDPHDHSDWKILEL